MYIYVSLYIYAYVAHNRYVSRYHCKICRKIEYESSRGNPEKKSHRSVYRIHLIRFYQHCLSKHTRENERVGGRRIMAITQTDTKSNEHTSALMHMIREIFLLHKNRENRILL